MVFNCVINKNNPAFVINLIYVMGDYATRLPIFILLIFILGSSVIKIVLAVLLAFWMKKILAGK